MPPVFFSLQLKIKSEVVNVDIFESDSIPSLAKRLCLEEGIKHTKQEKLQAKLTQSLTKLSHSDTISQVLQRKIRNLLNTPQPLHESLCTQIQISQKFEDDKENEYPKDVVINDWVGEEMTQERGSISRNPTEVGTVDDIREFVTEENIETEEPEEDQELIRAYKVIVARCKEPEIKRLVEQSLRRTNLARMQTQSSNIQRIMQPPSRQNSRIHTQTNSTVRYTYSPLRKSLYVFKGNSSNRFHQYATGQTRLYNNPTNLQYSIPCSKERRETGTRKYNYLKFDP